MLVPKRVKHRKWHKGRSRKRRKETRGVTLSYGQFGLKAMGMGWVTSRQIEAGRRAITGSMDREGKVFIRIFPDKPVTQRPPETTLGGGKGSVDHYVFPVRPGRIIFELETTNSVKAKTALMKAGHKLPFKCKVITADNI